jgi:hypothetical protein
MASLSLTETRVSSASSIHCFVMDLRDFTPFDWEREHALLSLQLKAAEDSRDIALLELSQLKASIRRVQVDLGEDEVKSIEALSEDSFPTVANSDSRVGQNSPVHLPTTELCQPQTRRSRSNINLSSYTNDKYKVLTRQLSSPSSPFSGSGYLSSTKKSTQQRFYGSLRQNTVQFTLTEFPPID